MTDRYVKKMPDASTTDRLVAAAGDLFYARGIGPTGVDAVSRAARVTKPTLYAHFSSKEDLVAAVLRRRHERRVDELTARLGPVDPRHRPLAVFDWLADFYARAGHRGCGFLNAAAELPGDGPPRAAVQAEKVWLHDLLVRLCREAGHADAERLGSVLLLLVDGVAGRVVVHGHGAAAGAVADARSAAEVLLGQYGGRP